MTSEAPSWDTLRAFFALAGVVAPPAASWPRSATDAEALHGMAERVGALGILWRRLRAAGELARLPAAVAAEMPRRAMAADLSALHARRRLREALAVLEARGIAAMPLKGAALLVAELEGSADRPMADIDLLVAPAQVARAWDALASAGWHAGAGPDRSDAGHHHLPPLDEPGRSGLYLELHTELMVDGHPFALAAADLWARSRVAPGWAGHRLASPEDQLLHVCVHFAWSHSFEYGGWRALRNVDVLLGAGVDWTRLVERARTARAGAACEWTLRLARAFAGSRLPDAVLAALAPRRAPVALRALLLRHLALVAASERSCPSDRLRQLLWTVAMRPGASGHGARRPWSHAKRLPTAAAAAPTAPSHRGWGRYAARLLGPSGQVAPVR